MPLSPSPSWGSRTRRHERSPSPPSAYQRRSRSPERSVGSRRDTERGWGGTDDGGWGHRTQDRYATAGDNSRCANSRGDSGWSARVSSSRGAASMGGRYARDTDLGNSNSGNGRWGRDRDSDYRGADEGRRQGHESEDVEVRDAVSDSKYTIAIHGLSKNVAPRHLREIFGAYGDIKKLELLIHARSGDSKGEAYVSFHAPHTSHSSCRSSRRSPSPSPPSASTANPAQKAVAHMHQGQIDGTIIEVKMRAWPYHLLRVHAREGGREIDNDGGGTTGAGTRLAARDADDGTWAPRGRDRELGRRTDLPLGRWGKDSSRERDWASSRGGRDAFGRDAARAGAGAGAADDDTGAGDDAGLGESNTRESGLGGSNFDRAPGGGAANGSWGRAPRAGDTFSESRPGADDRRGNSSRAGVGGGGRAIGTGANAGLASGCGWGSAKENRQGGGYGGGGGAGGRWAPGGGSRRSSSPDRQRDEDNGQQTSTMDSGRD
ncbi:hypothetical protein K437DRAFT_295331 [Tilletiaria anomala UBC 951]|uniref:RRM domain-containing protein n=1 Tax=Tilletiaria anomala (strain ATCC 24038 / CBS 436.72 / UBC 951) TaxID=1037660 RepID=A0A066VM98_TILAU|nr:uncharacterized protein K437DRAFT_295331 [Tilletiaria anomala UBC 951]KDN42631.1 hypothetical protein K437DRAFT_295331 [Tilletiaria anomala UBC 951]